MEVRVFSAARDDDDQSAEFVATKPDEEGHLEMTIGATETSPRNLARVAGGLYLILAVTGAFGILTIPTLVVPGDAAATGHNILASETLFRFSIVSGLIGQTVFILLVLALYKLLKPVQKSHAMLMVIFALVGIPIAMLNALNQVAALLLLSGSDYLTAFTSEQLGAMAMFFLELSEHGVFLVQIFWGLWLLPFGYLVFRSGFLPRILGILLMIGGIGYLADFLIFYLLPTFDMTFSEVSSIGEPLILLWLLIKGVDVEQWERRALESA